LPALWVIPFFLMSVFAGCDQPGPNSSVVDKKAHEIPFGYADQVKLAEADTTRIPARFKKGYVMLYRRDLPGLLFIVNARGEIVWYHEVDSAGFKVATYTSRSTILALLAPLSYPTSYGNEILELSLAGDTLLHLKKEEKGFDKTIHHEILYNPSGQLVTLTLEDRPFDLSRVGGSKNDTVRGDGILVMDRKGNKVWEWSVFDVFDPRKDPHILKDKGDWLHANSLSFDNDGNYLLSFYRVGEIWKIDAHTGKVIWKFGRGRDFQLRSGDWFTESHTVYKVDDDELVLFENGIRNNTSRVLTYRLDEFARTAILKDKMILPPNLYTERMGSAYSIDDSVELVCSAQAGSVVLINRQAGILWRLRTGFIPYRAAFIPGDSIHLPDPDHPSNSALLSNPDHLSNPAIKN